MKSRRKRRISRVTSKSRFHVVPRGKQGWAVKGGQGSGSVRYFQTKKKALAFSRDEVETRGGELVIHDRQGKIMKHLSFGTKGEHQPAKVLIKAGFGGAKDLIVIKDDFESPIEDFSEYV